VACLHPSKRRTFCSRGDELSPTAVSDRITPSVASVTPLRTEVQWVESLKPVPDLVNFKSAASGDETEAELLGVGSPPSPLTDVPLSSSCSCLHGEGGTDEST
jgi:hypothetical protein